MVAFHSDKCGVLPLDHGDITTIDTDKSMYKTKPFNRDGSELKYFWLSGIIKSKVSCVEITKAVSNSV